MANVDMLCTDVCERVNLLSQAKSGSIPGPCTGDSSHDGFVHMK